MLDKEKKKAQKTKATLKKTKQKNTPAVPTLATWGWFQKWVILHRLQCSNVQINWLMVLEMWHEQTACHWLASQWRNSMTHECHSLTKIRNAIFEIQQRGKRLHKNNTVVPKSEKAIHWAAGIASLSPAVMLFVGYKWRRGLSGALL